MLRQVEVFKHIRYKQAIKKKSTMTLLSKLKSLSGLKTQNNEKENISLTLFLQFDNFIARGQGRENKNLVFFPTALFSAEPFGYHFCKSKRGAFVFLFFIGMHHICFCPYTPTLRQKLVLNLTKDLHYTCYLLKHLKRIE